jgi:hypothetical protein
MSKDDLKRGQEVGIVQGVGLGAVCEGLLSRIFHQPTYDDKRGIVISVTSPQPDAGVSQITHALADALRRGEDECAIAVQCRRLRHGEAELASPLEGPGLSSQNLWNVASGGRQGGWHSTQTNLARALDELRRQYRYVLIDCASMKETQDAVRLASLVDGIVLVIEANRTQKEQILHAERTLESARGKILGYVLNKRTYAVPNWCYRAMDAVGL